MDAATTVDQGKTRSHKKKEVHTTDLPVGQPGDLEIPADGDFEHPSPVIERLNGIPVTKEYLAELAFNEEPMTVNFHVPPEQFSPPFVDCYSNGKGIERLLDNGRWMEVKQVPCGVNVTIKRKYVGILAEAKEMTIRADYSDRPGQDPVNNIRRTNALKHPFSVIEDKNPRGSAWLQALIAAK